MTGEIEHGPARAEDAAAIVAVIRSGFDPALVDATVYGCAGADRYVGDGITLPERREAITYTVARSGDRLVGAAEMRIEPGALFLNYIAVAPEARRGGTGSRLLRAAIDRSRSPERASMRLDVFEGNLPARRWYERLGFRAGDVKDLWSLPLSEPQSAAPGDVIVWPPEAVASQERYGFSSAPFPAAFGPAVVGRLGTKWFRLTDPRALRDEALLARLAHDPQRRLLAILPESTLPDAFRESAVRVERSLRMAAEINRVVSRLG